MPNAELNADELNINNEFDKIYEPLLNEFKQRIKDFNKINLPEPFIPVYGEKYANTEYKIAFIGWETRDNSSLDDFYIDALKDTKKSLRRFFEDIYAGEKVTIYGNNFGASFWDFIIKFLANFYCIDWKQLKNESNSDILRSFIWGNLESIERFTVTAKGMGVNFQDWEKIKQASSIFDKADHIIKALGPKVLVILHWDDDDSWLNIRIDDKHEIIFEDNLEYYHLLNTDTHVYWTKHPGSLSRNKIDFNHIIINILRSINEKNVFVNFPGQQILKSIDNLYAQIERVGQSLGLKVEIRGFWDKENGIYFRNQNWKYCMIGFEFEDNWGTTLFGGICRIDNNIPILNKNSIIVKLQMKEEPTEYWPYWFWFNEEYKDWTSKLYDEKHYNIFIDEIKTQVERMFLGLKELEKEGVQL